MSNLSILLRRIVATLTDHFTIGDEPPPPCPDSFTALMVLQKTLGDLRKSLPSKGNFHSRDAVEIYRHEITSKVWCLVEELTNHFTIPKDHVGGLSGLPPIPQQTIRSLQWAVVRLEELEPKVPPKVEPKNRGGRPVEWPPERYEELLVGWEKFKSEAAAKGKKVTLLAYGNSLNPKLSESNLSTKLKLAREMRAKKVQITTP